MIYFKIFWAFFISNLLGYGGGPSTIPLIQKEVVDHYKWLSLKEFGDLLALGNALPGPIATKIAGFVGFQVGGSLGAATALAATVLPSAIAVILLFKFVDLFKDSDQVKAMTRSVQPVIAVLLGILAWQFFLEAKQSSGTLHTFLLGSFSYIFLYVKHTHPAWVITGSLVYGAIFLG
ncbi:chromate transporter [Melghirimyces profundicolus]|uniref:Chromate transporter n=1 Tax=Melghirimyces profundicolus TaxID=1242148 RepID=A0A2T6C8N8_9BACL|nr:chromate transporter [Melghirimyces profundicolus]PTX64663.1 chromate transporter [Melghirimyces profundicolus]